VADVGEEESLGDGDVGGVLVGGGVGGALVGVPLTTHMGIAALLLVSFSSLLNPFPLSNGHLDRVSFSSQSHGTQSSRKDHHTIGVSCLGYN
jgi:hypothetical protein